MKKTTIEPTTIIRTEGGLTISGTRITLYDVMDYLVAQYPPHFIKSFLNLTENQLSAALAYIEANRAEVEAEYQIVLQENEELKQYYTKKNQELLAKIALRPPPLGQEKLWQKIQEQKAKLQSKLNLQA